MAASVGPDELPGGYWDGDGVRHREVELAPLTGREEELLVGARGGADVVTEVLARCVRRLGTLHPVPPSVVADLLVADRLYLLLRLGAAAFGEQVTADLVCPWPDCGERVSLSFSLADVPVVPAPDPRPTYTVAVADPAVGDVELRLPTGADQAELAPLAAENEAAALTGLLARCVLRLGAEGPPSVERVRALPAAVRAELEQHLHDLSPRVEQTMEARCAECGRTFLAPFDVERYLFGELRAESAQLFREVHYLAFHYHWSEHEILAMTRDRRRTYIDVLGETIEGLDSAS